jgi:hypothetical protein
MDLLEAMLPGNFACKMMCLISFTTQLTQNDPGHVFTVEPEWTYDARPPCICQQVKKNQGDSTFGQVRSERSHKFTS